MLLAEFQVGQVLWSMLWFFMFFIWIMLLFQVLADVFRSDDMGGWAKAAWVALVIFLPFLGVFVYLIARGDKMGARQTQMAEDQDAAFQSYVRDAAGSDSSASQLSQLADLHTAGKITDDEYAAGKAKILG